MKNLVLLAAALAMPALATPADLRSVAGMQSHNRVLLVFSPTLRDPRLAAERHEMSAAALQASARDLVFVQVAEEQVIGAHDGAPKLRLKHKVPADAFRVLLIGKDGNVALTSDTPVTAAKVMQAIDAMPMRQDEIRRAKQGRGVTP